MNSSFLCIEAYIMCIILTAILFKFNIRTSYKGYKKIVLIVSLLIFSSVLGIIDKLLDDNFIFNVLYLNSFGVMGYIWHNYCLEIYNIDNKILKTIFLLPVLFALITTIVSKESYYVIINYLYIVSAVIIALINGKLKNSRRVTRKGLSISLCALPTLLGLFNVFIADEFPVVEYSVYISLFVLVNILLKKEAATDNLTKILNRYGMDDEIEVQLRQYKKNKKDSFCIVVCDMDNFKTINDTWGHLEGDRALTLIADALNKVVADFDAEVFRIGGDEFVIITDTSEDGIGDKVCSAVKEELDKIDFRDDFEIRMSMGVSLYDGSCPITELISNADKKLYQAKQKNKEQCLNS